MVQISVKEAKEKITKIFMNVGVNEDEAAIIADMLVQADQRGVNSHGILSTARYVKLIREGKMIPNMNVNVVKDNGVVAVWDGNHSSGQILGYRAMEAAIEKARKNGIGVVCVKGANHFGALAYYSQMAQKAGMIGTVLGTGDSTMAPWGGCEKVIGNNPVCVAAPARNEVSPVLDMAMTVVANGKVSNMKRQGATEDIFIGGDVLTGPKFVIDAIAQGHEASESLHRFVQNGHMTIGRNKREFIELDKDD